MTASPLSLLRSGAVQVVTREGFDLAYRSRLAGSAAAAVPARSCVVDSEAIACNENGLAVFDMILYRRHDDAVIVCAFNLLELDGETLHRERGAKGHAQESFATCSGKPTFTLRRTARAFTGTPARLAAMA